MNNESGNPRSSARKAAVDPASKVPHRNIDDEVEPDKPKVDGYIARSLGSRLQMLTDDFWSQLPAQIEKINLTEHELTLSVRLPFLSPPPFGDLGDRLATQEEVDQIRAGFADFLREQQSVSRRLAGFFYSEFYDFLLGYSKIYRFNDDIRKLIKRPGERRLAARPSLPIPKSRKVAVREQLQIIYVAVLEMQKNITKWISKKPSITKDAIRDRLKLEYDREQYPWSRFAFRNVNTLPGKRAYGPRPGNSKNMDELSQPSIAEPERWSVPDIAAKWTRDWFFTEHGCRYDLRAIRKLLKTS